MNAPSTPTSPYAAWSVLQLVAGFDAVHTACECLLMGQHRPQLEDIIAPLDDELEYLARRRQQIVEELARCPDPGRDRDEWARVLVTYENLCNAASPNMLRVAGMVATQVREGAAR